VVAEEPDRLADEVIEVQRARVVLPPLVPHVDLRDDLLVEVRRHLGECVGRDHAVLRLGDRRGHRLRREPLRVDIELLEDAGDQPFGVTVVVDREARGNAEMRVLAAEDAGARRVERQDPHAPGDARANQSLDAFGHLPRRLVREGDGVDLVRADPVFPDQVGDPMGERPGLAAPRAGDDQDRALGVQDRLALDVVERLEQGGHRRGHARPV